MDLAASIVEKNKDRVPGATFCRLNIEREVLDKQFDLIVCSEVIEHLHDQKQALRNMAAMVNRGGHMLVTCPTGRLHNTERHFGHIRHPTIDELIRLGKENNLSVLSSLNWGWPAYKALKFVSNLDYRWALREFAGGEYSQPKRAVCQFLYLLNFLNMRNSKRGCQLFVLFQKN